MILKLFFLAFLSFLLVFTPLALKAQTSQSSTPTQLPLVQQGDSIGLNADSLSFSDLQFTSDGSGYGLSWQKGQSMADILTTSSLDLDEISGLAGELGLSSIDPNALIKDVPGLANLPLNKIFKDIGYFPFAIHDSTHGKEDHNSSFKAITGSEVVGYNYPCNMEDGKQQNVPTAYTELSDYRGVLGPLKGNRFCQGGERSEGGQMVPGGRGTFKGQLEPTGRPLGFWFKIVAIKHDQPTGSTTYTLYTRACDDLKVNCTPFIIGPLGTWTSVETGPVFLGTQDTKENKGKGIGQEDLKLTPSATQALGAAQQALGASGTGGADRGIQDSLNDCANKALRVVSSDKTNAAANMIPQILSIGSDQNYDANQMSFILAAADSFSYQGDAAGFVSQFGPKAKQHISSTSVDFNAAAGGNSQIANKASQFQQVLKDCFQTSCGSGFIRPTNGPLTSGYGYRVHPLSGTTKFHDGVDFGDPMGTPIKAVSCGKVVHAGTLGGYGTTAIIQHQGGIYSLSAHMSEINVRVGDTVEQGRIIGKVGSTGMSTGPHLHLGMEKPLKTSFDPASVIPGI
jgi:hypothetical protein